VIGAIHRDTRAAIVHDKPTGHIAVIVGHFKVVDSHAALVMGSRLCYNRLMEMICGECHKTFTRPDAWAKRGGGRFCSRVCYSAHQRKHPHSAAGVEARPREARVCVHCGKHFTASAREPRRVHCSYVCYKAARSVEVTCAICGKTFTTQISNVRKGQRYCSMECTRKDTQNSLHTCARCGVIYWGNPTSRYCSEACHRPPHLFTCLHCGKEIRTQPSRIATSRFCSPQCYRRYTGETEPEAGARKCLEQLGVTFIQEFAVPGWRYPADFCLPDAKTIIEIDSVYWHGTARAQAQDARKTLRLQRLGYRVVRLPDTPFYGPLTDGMVAYLRAALDLADHASAQWQPSGLYPIQLSFPLNEERML
jgi:very-short-patch-repair endonuclease